MPRPKSSKDYYSDHRSDASSWDTEQGGANYGESYGTTDNGYVQESGRYELPPREKKQRFGLFEAVAAASTAFTKDRMKRPRRGSQHRNGAFSPLPQSYDGSADSGHTPVSSLPPQLENPNFSTGGKIIREENPFDNAEALETGKRRAQKDRNLDSSGSTVAQPGSISNEDPEQKTTRTVIRKKGNDPQTESNNIELVSIERDVLRAKLDFPELQGPKHESAEDAVHRIIEQYEQLSKPLRDKSGRLSKTNPSRSELRRAEDEINDTRQKVLDWSKAYEELQRRHAHDMDQLNKTIAHLKFENSQQLSQHGDKMRREQNQRRLDKEQLEKMYDGLMSEERHKSAMHLKTIKEWEHQIGHERTQYHANMRRLEGDKDIIKSHLAAAQGDKDSLKSRLAAAQGDKDALKSRLASAQADKDDLKSRLASAQADKDFLKGRLGSAQREKETLESRLASIQGEFNSRLQEEKDNFERRLTRERTQYEESNAALQATIAAMKSETQEQLLTQERQLTEKHEFENLELQKVIEEFKVASVQRDHFKGLTDRDVADHFLRIANDIEDFSRLQWDLRKEQDWPYTEDQMRQLNKVNTRKLKQQLVQNSIWMILYEHVFRSPFRIFGFEGRDIDADWIDVYASDKSPYEWPDIPAEVERSRYESAKAFLDAIDSPGNNRGKDGYEDSVITILNTMCRALNRVTTVERKHTKILEGILRLSTKVWLELCSQRYRLVVIILDGSDSLLTSMSANTGSLSLVLRPDLKRYGDSHGSDLTRGEAVSGWRGQVETYPS
ncbi:hypothetical protein IQ07DRAFT_634948 [Pyrenochaeta sp. DS3sAY3a]|nr:hypothetical protein IQ07DRAFT_634948 [Pyrenochaeta sp. DS3sAY3a]